MIGAEGAGEDEQGSMVERAVPDVLSAWPDGSMTSAVASGSFRDERRKRARVEEAED